MPTSLIFVLLAVLWLIVLVPIVARRREKVPETDESGAHFRVLHRASGTLRRKRFRGRDAEVSDETEDVEVDELDEVETGPLDEELLDDESDTESDPGSDAGSDLESDTESVRYGEAAPEPVAVAEPVRAPAPRPGRAGRRYADAVPEQAPVAVAVAERPQHYEPELVEEVDDERYRPVPQRRGRGGYDPEAAERLRTYRYKRRRRVTAVLLLATVAFSLAAHFVSPLLWSGTAVCGLLLIGYLGYLRRQVRIEEDIRQRRMAKMRRARQIRPEYHAGARRPAEEPVTVTSGQRTTSVPPAAYSRSRQVVDLDDDDPGFDDLEYYEPYRYRRAAGQ